MVKEKQLDAPALKRKNTTFESGAKKRTKEGVSRTGAAGANSSAAKKGEKSKKTNLNL